MDTDFLEGLHKTTDISECQRKTKDEMPFVSEEAVCRIQLALFASYLKNNFTFSKISMKSRCSFLLVFSQITKTS